MKYDKDNKLMTSLVGSSHWKETRAPLSTYVLLQTAGGYLELGDKDMAISYFVSKAQSLANDEVPTAPSQPTLREKIEYVEPVNNHTVLDESEADLIFDAGARSLIIKGRGIVDFGNQFTMIDLMLLFVKNHGTVYSKEALIEYLWKEPYDPVAHDNKIYVTIRRLRQLVEEKGKRPRYIIKCRNGYCLSKLVRVLLVNK